MVNGFLTPRSFCIITLLLTVAAAPVLAQGTTFTYQGKLTDSGNPANGIYDFQFKLFDTGGTQLGTTQTVSSVAVTNGTFTVTLDFGACATCFDGSARFLEIAVKPTSGGAFTTLSPRQPITSTPYAIKSLTAATADALSVACVSCVTGSQIASVNGSVVSGQIPVSSVPAGSGNYIQNGTSQQPSSNFNISGNGTADILNAATQYNLGGNRVLSAAGTGNLLVGVNAGAANTANFNSFFGNKAGQANTTGDSNSFFGFEAGVVNTTGFANAFFGRAAGFSNTGGNNNAFFGASAGQANTSGSENSFFGRSAGLANTTGMQNSFFGIGAGQTNSTGDRNAFFGSAAGSLNTTASDNAFFGTLAGQANTTGSENTFLGKSAGLSNTTGAFNVFAGTFAGQTNSIGNNNAFFGRAAGANSTASDNSFFGTSAGQANTTGGSNTFFGRSTGQSNASGFGNTFVGAFSDFSVSSASGDFNVLLGYLARVTSGINNATAIGTRALATQSNSLVLGSINGVNGATADTNVGIGTTTPADRLHVNGIIRVATLGAADTTTTLCRNSLNQIATCNSSSLRYKTNITAFSGGLDVVRQLRPITFTWKQSGLRDLGYAAEEVAKVEPLLTFTNEQGQIEGVKYDRINVALVNAVKELAAENDTLKQKLSEQQTRAAAEQQQLRQQQEQIKQQQQEMEAIKRLLCSSQPQADFCKTRTLK